MVAYLFSLPYSPYYFDNNIFFSPVNQLKTVMSYNSARTQKRDVALGEKRPSLGLYLKVHSGIKSF